MRRAGRKKIPCDPELLDKIESLAANHLKHKHIYSYLNISKNAWFKLIRRYPEIKERILQGKSKTILAVTSKLMQKIKEGNLDAIKFFLKTQAGWCENTTVKVKSDVKSSPGKIEKIEGVDPVEASRIYQKHMAGSQENERNSTSD